MNVHYLKEELYNLVKSDSSIFDFIQEGVLDGIWYWDLEQPENEWMSDRFWEVLGYDPKTKKHLTSEWQDIINQDDLQLAMENFNQHVQDPTVPYDQLVRYKHQNGSTVIIRCRGLIVRDDNGTPIRMLGAHSNFTETLQNNKSNFIISSKDYEETFHAAGLGIARADLNGKFLEVNDTLCEMLHYTSDELSNLSFQDITYPDDLNKNLSLKDKILNKEIDKYSIEKRYIKKNGEIIWVKLSVSLVYADDMPKYFIGIVDDITALKNTQKLLKESEERLQYAMTASNDGLWDWNIKTNEVYFALKWKEMLGFKDDEISGSLEEWEKRIHPDDKEQVFKDVQEYLEGKSPVYVNEHRVLCKNGHYMWILDRGVIAERNDQGDPVRMVGTHSDIDETTRLKEAVNNERLRYQSLLRFASDGILILNLEGKLLEFSQNAAKILGYSMNDMSQLSVYDWDDISPEEYNDIAQMMTDEPITFERQHKRKDGTIYDAEITATKVTINGQHLIYASVRDITQKKRLNKELAEQKYEQEVLLSLFDKGEANLFKWKNNETWSIEYVSENVDLTFGYTADEFLNANVLYSKCIHPDDLLMIEKEVQTAITNNVDFFKHKPYRIITKSGEIRWLLHYTATQKNGDNNITHFISYIVDSTVEKLYEEEIIKAKEEAIRANKSKSEFLANMSHEIRTPMTGILGFVDQLAKNEKDSKRLEQFQIIKSSGKNLLVIINDILDLSKIESGKMSIEVHANNIHELFHSTYMIFKDLSQEKGIELKYEQGTSLPKCLLCDVVRLKQIVMNLLSNAIKFTPKKGTITLGVSYNDSSLYCFVEDNGIGIGQDKLTSIFSAFEQEDASTTRKFGGTGLGLSISAKLIELMNGKLQVSSKQGEGSKFYFNIPLEICDLDSTDKETLVDTYGSIDLMGHVLIVEDNKTNQLLLGLILDEIGISYDIANDGVEALTLFDQKNYNLILMDENMPNLNGTEATQRIRQLENQRSCKPTHIVAVTANALAEDKKRFLDAGMNDYISKPYDEKDIMRVLVKFLKK